MKALEPPHGEDVGQLTGRRSRAELKRGPAAGSADGAARLSGTLSPRASEQAGDQLDELAPECPGVIQPGGDDGVGDIGVYRAPVCSLAGWGAPYDQAAPVGGVAVPGHIPGPLQPVQDLAHGLLLDHARCREFALRARPGSQRVQRQQPGMGHVPGSEPAVPFLLHQAGGHREQAAESPLSRIAGAVRVGGAHISRSVRRGRGQPKLSMLSAHGQAWRHSQGRGRL